MVAGRRKPVTSRAYRRVERAVQQAEQETGLQFVVYLGPSGTDEPRARAERLLVEAGLVARPAVVLLVDPEKRRVEVVTAPEARARVDDPSAADAVNVMIPRFAKGDVIGGLVAGIRRLAEAAGPGRAAPGAEELPDLLHGTDEGETS